MRSLRCLLTRHGYAMSCRHFAFALHGFVPDFASMVIRLNESVNVQVSYTNVVLPLAELEAEEFPLVQSCIFPKMVSGSDDVRKASAQAEGRIDAHKLSCRSVAPVYSCHFFLSASIAGQFSSSFLIKNGRTPGHMHMVRVIWHAIAKFYKWLDKGQRFSDLV